MKTTTELSNKFYQHLGKLFYAVASADKLVHEAENKKLKQLIRTDWLQVDDAEDEFGTDTAFQIEIIFDWLTENDKDPRVCLDEFKKFKAAHENLFDHEIKQLIWKTANAIATSTTEKNKSELIMLARLSEILK